MLKERFAKLGHFGEGGREGPKNFVQDGVEDGLVLSCEIEMVSGAIPSTPSCVACRC